MYSLFPEFVISVISQNCKKVDDFLLPESNYLELILRFLVLWLILECKISSVVSSPVGERGTSLGTLFSSGQWKKFLGTTYYIAPKFVHPSKLDK